MEWFRGFLAWLVQWLTGMQISDNNLGWGSAADWCAALASSLAALVSIATLFLALGQLRTLTRQHRQSSTLQACDRYDTTSPLVDAVVVLRQAYRKPKSVDNWHHVIAAANRLFNFFDSIAIGVSQKMYDDAIAKTHLRSVIENRWKEVVGIEHSLFREEFLGSFNSDFPSLTKLMMDWHRPLIVPKDELR